MFLLCSLLNLGACSAPSSVDVTDVIASDAIDVTAPDVTVSDAIDATAVDVTDVIAPDVTDATAPDVTVSDVSDVRDVTDAVVDAVDAGSDAPAVSFQAMVHITLQSQNCQPSVPPDPMTLTGTVDVDNFGTLDLGPISASEGIFVRADGVELARFAIAPITIPAVARGAAGHASFTKTAGSLTPASGCSAVPCGAAIRVEVPITGANIPAGTRAISAITVVGCVF